MADNLNRLIKNLNEARIRELLAMGKKRIELAKHYGIPYERPEYLPPSTSYGSSMVRLFMEFNCNFSLQRLIQKRALIKYGGTENNSNNGLKINSFSILYCASHFLRINIYE